VIRRLHADNYGVYGDRKIWAALRRAGHRVARCTIERLMRDAGLAGAARGRKNSLRAVRGLSFRWQWHAGIPVGFDQVDE
jgi:transposase InsO family protein